MITALKLVVVLVAGLLVMLLVAGQLGLFKGRPPSDLGVRDGRLKAPSKTPNSVSSQAGLYPMHPQRAYADIAPLDFLGSEPKFSQPKADPSGATHGVAEKLVSDPNKSMQRLTAMLEATPGCVLVTREPRYLYAQCSTRWLKFTDDVEFYIDETAGAIQVRSASRLGRKDFGVNRARVEALRERYPTS